jgi:hypothetical protein
MTDEELQAAERAEARDPATKPEQSDKSRWAARDLPAEEITRGFKGNGRVVREQLMSNPSLTEDHLFFAMQEEWLLPHVARHPRLPQRWWQRFLSHPDVIVRSSLACNPSLTAEVQLQLAGDSSAQVRAALRNQPHLTPEAQQKLDETDAKAKASP